MFHMLSPYAKQHLGAYWAVYMYWPVLTLSAILPIATFEPVTIFISAACIGICFVFVVYCWIRSLRHTDRNRQIWMTIHLVLIVLLSWYAFVMISSWAWPN